MRWLYNTFSQGAVACLMVMIRGYQLIVSPWLPMACRYQPTCSAYAREALWSHGLGRGCWLTLRRLSQCHPWGGSGVDEVPAKPDSQCHPATGATDIFCETHDNVHALVPGISGIFLDRDGVINTPPVANRWILNPDELQLAPGAAEAIRALNEACVPVVVITNQACVGRGILTVAGLDAIHQRMHDLLKAEGAHIDALYCCTDYPPLTGPSTRRKPAPGMLLEALEDFNLTPAHVAFVGDALTDVQAALAAGCVPHLVRTGHGVRDEAAARALHPTINVHASLRDAVDCLLKQGPYYAQA